ncbi:hypothetical protein C8Q72DRAFT_556482 [Fomitopsis betulina]|nr:hypothetical protein C8Q72DRAFT_556482 [Fomitopsis betulina]
MPCTCAAHLSHILAVMDESMTMSDVRCAPARCQGSLREGVVARACEAHASDFTQTTTPIPIDDPWPIHERDTRCVHAQYTSETLDVCMHNMASQHETEVEFGDVRHAHPVTILSRTTGTQTSTQSHRNKTEKTHPKRREGALRTRYGYIAERTPASRSRRERCSMVSSNLAQRILRAGWIGRAPAACARGLASTYRAGLRCVDPTASGENAL